MIKTVTVTKTDYVNFTNYAFKRLSASQPKGGTGFIKNMIIWCISAIAFMFVFQMDSISLSSFHWPSAAIAALPFVVFIAAYAINMRELRQLSTPKENALMLGEKTIELAPAGITEINPGGSCFYKWNSVESVEDNNGDLYIFLDKLLAVIIPASSFSSDIEKADLQSIVKKYV